MSNITISKGSPSVITATVPAGQVPNLTLEIYSPNNKRLSVTIQKSQTPNGDGSTSVSVSFNCPDSWFTGNVLTAFIDCNQCGYGQGKYVLQQITATSYPVPNLFKTTIATGSISVDAPAPSDDLLDETCPDCSDSGTTGGGTGGGGTAGTSDPLVPPPPVPPAPCLPPDFVNPTPPVPGPSCP